MRVTSPYTLEKVFLGTEVNRQPYLFRAVCDKN